MCPVTDRTFSYQPGGWFGIVGEHATALLPGTEKARAGALWVLVDDGAGFDAVLDALVANGLSSLPGFVLLARDGETTRVVIRGDAEATFEAAEGTVHVAGSGGSMWVERVLHAVTRLSISLPGELPAGPWLTIAEGLVRVASLEAPAEVARRAAPPAGPPPAPRLELVPDPLTDEIDLSAPEEQAPEEHAPGQPAPEEQPPTGGPLGEPPSWTPPAVPPPPPPPLPAVPPAPAFPPPAPPTLPPPSTVPPPSPSVPAWEDDATEQIPAMPSLPDPEPEPEPEPEPDAEPFEDQGEEPDWDRPGPVAHLSFSSGAEVDVDGLVVIGRAPDAGRFPTHEAPILVAVPSPHSEISSTHVEVRPGTGDDLGSAVVTDLGSTNGTLLVQPGHRPEELRPGVPVVLQVGALIDLGDGLTIRVTED